MQQRSTVDSRRRLTNFTVLVSQSMSAVLRQSVELLSSVKPSECSKSTVCCGCCQNQLHFWILNFHKVAQQHIAGVVEIFVVYNVTVKMYIQEICVFPEKIR